ncbi:RNA polymerase sigma factor [Cohnella luojiensis]|uniref:Sigma-70 family RNA polymerase sigma factor n=1 Tax=Cohnella luojiensis TaxID=652876 RepID=A0A4Y8LPE9_9BACL|nr:sigma-70 family RNA polymerase sigma factor [Cohnella luojiensis]TFE22841.1 sigma-70 family RNA polymerase sigma factor [Cohnella luojiensis]
MDMQHTVGRGIPAISYEQLFEHYKDKIFSFAWKILRSKMDSEEAVQETFLKLYVNFERLDPAGSVSSLIFTTTKNICIDILRKRKTKLTLAHPMMKHEGWEDQAAEAQRPEDVLILKEASEILLSAIEKLPKAYRLMVYQRYVLDMSMEEIVDMNQVKMNTVKSRLKRGRDLLKKHMEKG